MPYRLQPRPGGYYDKRFWGAPTIKDDLYFLIDGDAHNSDPTPWSLRSEVLIVAVDEPMEAEKTA